MPVKRTLLAIGSTMLVAGVSLVCLLAGCDDDEPSALSLLGSGCLLNSDCDEGLSCVFERCHIECNTSADCPLDTEGERLRCVVGAKPEHVCQLEDETDCAYHSECPGLQICGPDGECRDQCKDDRDCVAGQSCVAQGVCADAEEIDDDGELPAALPPEDQETGYPCAYDSQCLGLSPIESLELVCRNGGCNWACFDDVDCDPGFGCFPADGDRTTPGNCAPLLPTPPCVPGSQAPCTCFMGGPGFQVCAADGQRFEPCLDVNTGLDCSPP